MSHNEIMKSVVNNVDIFILGHKAGISKRAIKLKPVAVIKG